jgi:hypothetical protein
MTISCIGGEQRRVEEDVRARRFRAIRPNVKKDEAIQALCGRAPTPGQSDEQNSRFASET